VDVEPIVPITSMIHSVNLPNFMEWILLMWISGLVARELSNPSDKGGFGVLKVGVLILTTTACAINIISFCYQADDNIRYDILFTRNIFLSLTTFLALIQFIDFLQFHILVGSWGILLRFLINDLIRLFVLSIIFLMGFTFFITAINQDAYPNNSTQSLDNSLKNSLVTFRFLFFAIFGHVDPTDMPQGGFKLISIFSTKIFKKTLNILDTHPFFSIIIQKIAFGTYLVIMVIVCINTFIAMVTCTLKRFFKQSSVEWTYDKAKFIRNLTKLNSDVPTPLLLLTQFLRIVIGLIKFKG
jgi:hypothetical protein